MTRSDPNDERRDAIVREIVARLPPELASVVETALVKRRGINFGSSDPEVVRLCRELNELDNTGQP